MKILTTVCQAEHFKSIGDDAPGGDVPTAGFDNIFLLIETDAGISGCGVAAPDKEVTGEDVESVLEAYHQRIEPILHGADPLHYSRIYEQLEDAIPGETAAMAMVEIALYDLIARKAGIPLYVFLGGYRDRIRTSVTLGLLPDEEILRRVRVLLDKGVRAFKLKGGKDVERDIRIVGKLGSLLPRGAEINFDAEQGYSLIEAAHFIRHTRHTGLSMLEQPTTPELTFQWHLLRQESDILVMADESLRKLSDSFILTSRQVVDMLNIKLMKVGGITPALQINSSARSASVRCMMGCMQESSLGAAAALHVALARPNITHADLDSWMWLERDPYIGIMRMENGFLYPNGLPGLGRKAD
jgi:L-alanine-DL-glutamate epimerase-like enolase superfamily enzyme